MASEVISTTIKLLGQLDPSVQKAMGAAEKAAGSTGKKISAAMVAGFTAVSAAAVAVVKQIADIGDQYQQASGQIAAATGATGEELAGLQDVMKNVYGNNFGEDMNDVANAISNINQQMSGLNGAQLENVTEQAFMLRDTFEYDIPESIRAANAITNQFGTDAEYAMNLIATGAQNGLDYSGELLDTISEYSVQFAKVGFSADDMFKILQTGADTGAWNLDKVGDAIKEMSVRVVDGSETTAVAFGDMGLDAEEMAAKFAAGGDTARDAFFETVSALANMDDKVQQNIAGVGLFGTMWEDLGADVVLQLANITDKAYASKNAFEQINNLKYNNLSSALEGVARKVDIALLPIGEKLAGNASKALGELSGIIEQVTPYIEQFTDVFSEKISGVIEWLEPYVMPIFDTMISGIQTFIPYIMNIVNALAPIIEMLKPVVEALLPAINNYLGFFISVASTVASIVSGALTTAIQFITPYLQDIVNIVVDIINKFSSFYATASNILNNLPTIVSNAITAISNFFINGWNWVMTTTQEIISSIATWLSIKWGEIKTGASEFIEGIKASFSNGFSTLVSIVKAPFDKILGFINNIKGAVGDLIGKITGAKSEAATITVPAHATGGTFTVPHLAVIGDAPETIVPHGNTAHNQALLMEAAKGVFGSNIPEITSMQSKIIDFPKIQDSFTSVPQIQQYQDNVISLPEIKLPEIQQYQEKVIPLPEVQLPEIQQYQEKVIPLPEVQLPEIQQYEALDDELETPEDDFEYIDIGGSSGDTYSFNVEININGGSGDIKNDVIEAEQEFERRIEQYLERKKRRQFA